jgi:hypothetical protein
MCTNPPPMCCSVDSWEALLVLAAVGDAFEDTGPAKAWELLQVCTVALEAVALSAGWTG